MYSFDFTTRAINDTNLKNLVKKIVIFVKIFFVIFDECGQNFRCQLDSSLLSLFCLGLFMREIRSFVLAILQFS